MKAEERRGGLEFELLEEGRGFDSGDARATGNIGREELDKLIEGSGRGVDRVAWKVEVRTEEVGRSSEAFPCASCSLISNSLPIPLPLPVLVLATILISSSSLPNSSSSSLPTNSSKSGLEAFESCPPFEGNLTEGCILAEVFPLLEGGGLTFRLSSASTAEGLGRNFGLEFFGVDLAVGE